MPKKAVAAKSKSAPALADMIQVRGARQNNLRGFDLDIPLYKLSVVTGPSGSGKSSLAFDTVYAEGQRRYVETFSPYTRQFFERMDKPKVDSIEGIPPAIAIEQTNNVRSTRSTVGTITEINDYLKMIFPRLAEATCPECKRPVRPETAETIMRDLLAKHTGETALIVFAIPVPAKTDAVDFAEFLQGQGFLRIWLYGEVIRLDDKDALKGRKLPQRVFVVQDRVTLDKSSQARLSEAVEAALRFGKGQMTCVFDTVQGSQFSVQGSATRSPKGSTENRELRTTPRLGTAPTVTSTCPRPRPACLASTVPSERAPPAVALARRWGSTFTKRFPMSR